MNCTSTLYQFDAEFSGCATISPNKIHSHLCHFRFEFDFHCWLLISTEAQIKSNLYSVDARNGRGENKWHFYAYYVWKRIGFTFRRLFRFFLLLWDMCECVLQMESVNVDGKKSAFYFFRHHHHHSRRCSHTKYIHSHFPPFFLTCKFFCQFLLISVITMDE